MMYHSTDDMVREVEEMIEQVADWEMADFGTTDNAIALVNHLRAAQDLIDTFEFKSNQ